MEAEVIERNITIRKAVKQVYDQMPKDFHVIKFCMAVRGKLKKLTMDGTILRRLRELRESGHCPYKVIDTVKGIYQKIEA